MDFNIWSYNCKGLKSSFGLVQELLDSSKCQMLFLCEHWLTPGEVSVFSKLFKESGLWVNLSSSIDPETTLLGRPFGGIGFIAKRMSNITFKPLVIDSDRVAGVQLICAGKVLLTVFGVYLPYYKGTHDQIQCYNETLSTLQCLLDTMEPSPVLIVGDMNTTLPQQQSLSRHWHRMYPHNNNSYILYDFLRNNELSVSNFAFEQGVNYTYFNAQSRSYIDHVFVSKYADNLVKSCKIMYEMSDNISDHYPICTSLVLSVHDMQNFGNNEETFFNVPIYDRIDWSNHDICTIYQQGLAQSALVLPFINPESIKSLSEAEEAVTRMTHCLTCTIHEECHKISSINKSKYKGKFKQNNWWNADCLTTRDRQRFWHNIWKSCERPRSGTVYECYKTAKKAYRKACRLASSGNIQQSFQKFTNMFKCKNTKQFWNLVRGMKRSNSSSTDIAMDTLYQHFTSKLSASEPCNSLIYQKSEKDVSEKYHLLTGASSMEVMTEKMLNKYISKLRLGCAPGIDGLMTEHFRYAMGTQIVPFLSNLFTLCIKFGIVPTSFSKGLLIPLLKKPTLDPTDAKHYRPVTISSTLSKILELYILDRSDHYELSDLQFGFIAGRGTQMASALTNDVISYSTKRGSPVYTCSLDAEGAFDAIPHAILFHKAMDALPDHCWKMLVYWYKSLSVQVKWGDMLSHPIQVSKGTRQGGLTSPLLFNMFYKDMIEQLSNTTGGIRIHGLSYNVFCYADDLLLTSLTVSGLQNLINIANMYIVDHGLRFNPSKTECSIFGPCYFDPHPQWKLNDTILSENDHVKYLGVILSHTKGNKHVEYRINSCRKAYYALQGIGLGNNTCNADTVSYIWSTAIRPVLTYGLQCISLSKQALQNLEKTQAKLLKTSLGLHKFCKNTPVLNAIKVNKIETSLDIGYLELVRSMFKSQSRAKPFYNHILNMHVCGKLKTHDDLVHRAHNSCNKYGISFIKYILDDNYALHSKKQIKQCFPTNDGYTDSVRQLLLSADPYDKMVLNMLLMPF